MSLSCKDEQIKGYYKFYRSEKIANACPYFVEEFEDYLEDFFRTWPNDLDLLEGVH